MDCFSCLFHFIFSVDKGEIEYCDDDGSHSRVMNNAMNEQ
jgi:hypothetical protein